ncbi:MAG: cell division protein FtsQ/DivIB [Methylophilaceae bacterium]|nr:MAG: cell division protein FtsQ/DivIB [Methylophilaceae bacterium]
MWHQPNQLNWLANCLYAAAIMMLLYGLIIAFIRLPIFPINVVEVGGQLEHVSRKQVELIVEEHLTGNFFTLDLKKTRDAFEKLPWTRNVSVRRHWPSTINVEIEEHKALARWGDIALVNTYGELFHGASDDDLPVFYGAGNAVKEVAQQYAQFKEILLDIDMQVTQVNLSPRFSWEIKTDKNVSIALGREHMNARLAQFSIAYQTVLSHLNTTIQYADLRYPNGFSLLQTNKQSMQQPPLRQMNIVGQT